MLISQVGYHARLDDSIVFLLITWLARALEICQLVGLAA